MATNVKQFLDKAGVEALWDRIYHGFAPRWQSYKPSNTSSSEEDKLPADFINVYESDHIVNGEKDGRKSLDINFVSAGAIKDAEGNKYGRDLVIQIPEVKAPTSSSSNDGAYGVMSPDDKWKLDHVGTTAEDKVTIKGVKVDGSELKLTDKFVNWDLQYDNSTYYLNVVDLNETNTANKIKTQVYLGDFIKDSFLSSATVVQLADGEVTNLSKGLYIKLVFLTREIDGGTTENAPIYINVNDLVDVYNGGVGIEISDINAGVEGADRTATINLKVAATTEIGGIKIAADNAAMDNTTSLRVEDATGRDFGVMLNKDDVAYVNVPVDTLEIVDSTIIDDSVAIATADSFQILAGYNKSESSDGDGWKLTPIYKTISVNKESEITHGTPADATDGGNKIDTSITIMTDISLSGTNNHTITPVYETYTFNETHLSLGTAADANNTISIIPSVGTATVNDIAEVPVSKYSGSFTTTAISAVNDHTITNQNTAHSFEIQIPAIEESFIDALVYRVQ